MINKQRTLRDMYSSLTGVTIIFLDLYKQYVKPLETNLILKLTHMYANISNLTTS